MDEMGYKTLVFIEFLGVLITEFDTKFPVFKRFHLIFKFLKNPFIIIDQNNIRNLSRKTRLDCDVLALINEETNMPKDSPGLNFGDYIKATEFDEQ